MSLKKAKFVLEVAQEMLTDGDKIIGHKAWTKHMHLLTTLRDREIIIRTLGNEGVSLQYFKGRDEWKNTGKGSDLISSKRILIKD
jgi:hypothetical protein